MRIRRTLVSGLAAFTLYACGCDGGDVPGGPDGSPDACVLSAVNEDNLEAKVGEEVTFRGMATCQPDVFWDKDDSDGTDSRDAVGTLVQDGVYEAPLSNAYAVPGKYTHTMHADTVSSPGTGKVRDAFTDRIGESLGEVYGMQVTEAVTAYDEWQGVQSDPRYAGLSQQTRTKIADYEANLARPFGTKQVKSVRIGDNGVLVYELANPGIYHDMPAAFDGLDIGQADAAAIRNILLNP